jgi:uncharacterized protein YyaL (SSP411 family)
MAVGESAIHWVGWSDELFARAKREHKFVILDLEAVWCHWCHVEDDITYRDAKVIDLISSRYIAVKVDQDSRPDLSNRYEDYGWPATIVFNADGGEIVKRSGYIPPGPMAAMLQAIIDDPTPGPSVRAQPPIEFGHATALTPELHKELEQTLADTYDEQGAGWGTVHKFVDWDAAEYLSSRSQGPQGQRDASRVRLTLAYGMKLIDPVWGGVYQYSTDGDWDHPHFEKLMAFQAEMLRTYSQAYARWQDPECLKAAHDLRRFMDDFLRGPDGAFYVSQDADLVPGEHSAGYFALGDADRRKQGVPRVDTHLYARENGWAIAGLVAQYAATGDASALEEAREAADWVIANRLVEGGGFRHDQVDAGGPYLADTLYMGRAFLALYGATAERRWLKRAVAAADYIAAHFAEPDDRPGYATAAMRRAEQGPSEQGRAEVSSDKPATSPTLAASDWQPRPEIDENVAAVRFFNLLGRYIGNDEQHKRADRAMRFLATPQVARSRQLWLAGILLADEELSSAPLHVTIVGDKDDPAAVALFVAALKAPGTYKRLEWYDPREGALPNADVEYPVLKAPAAFVCKGNTCSSPISSVEALNQKLGSPPTKKAPTPGER